CLSVVVWLLRPLLAEDDVAGCCCGLLAGAEAAVWLPEVPLCACGLPAVSGVSRRAAGVDEVAGVWLAVLELCCAGLPLDAGADEPGGDWRGVSA
ncbi:hypothetical protein IR009_23575, partial [Pseudomonas putida]|uniref:hypothetical protein n=1 Tax=Pseudomonas putida TaxID=303 RepID=UPI0018A9AF3C